MIRGLVKAGAIEAVEVDIDSPFPLPDPDHAPPVLSRRAAGARPDALVADVAARAFQPTLLDGVTGSGKTEVYFEAIAAAIRAGRQTLVLLPEIALTEPFLQALRRALRLRAGRVAFGPALSRSAAAPGARSRAARRWSRSARARRCSCPMRNLGLIVVDEAHETSFKQEEGVHYHARDVAVMRGKFEGMPGHPRLRHPGDRDAPAGRDRPLRRAQAARPLRRRRNARRSRRST